MRLNVTSVAIAVLLFAVYTPASNSTELVTHKSNTSEVDPHPCHFPETTHLAPGWVCGEPVEGYSLTAVGMAENRSGRRSENMLKNMALMNARVNLASQQQSTVEATAETTSTTVEATVETKILRIVSAPNGNLYVLIAVVE